MDRFTRSLAGDIVIPEELIADFASDPLSQYGRSLERWGDASCPLYGELRELLGALPEAAVKWAYSDGSLGINGRSDELARTWYAEKLLTYEASLRRLTCLANPGPKQASLPYSNSLLNGLEIDDEYLVRGANLRYNGASFEVNGHSYVTCLVNQNFNSTYWLQQAFFETGIAEHIRVRLDPYLWGRADSFPTMMYRMIVYAKPLNWAGIARLKEPHHGQMRPDSPGDSVALTEFCWTPRDDGIHFVCEELPQRQLIDVQASRYLHAIFDPIAGKISHLDGALRIYTEGEMDARLVCHLRNAGKAGTRVKVFRIDAPIDKEAFSLVAQAFFVWNYDLATYFRETLSAGE